MGNNHGETVWLSNYINESSRVKLSLLSQVSLLNEIIGKLVATIANGGQIFSCGNGGSACDAMHFTEELVARYQRERPGIKAAHFADPGTLTCWSNDYTFDTVFERQVQTFVSKKDALVVFTTSGNSKNILAALNAANKIGAITIALLGKGGGSAKELANLSLVVASNNTAHIQEAHIAVVHMICEGLEKTLFS